MEADDNQLVRLDHDLVLYLKSMEIWKKDAAEY